MPLPENRPTARKTVKAFDNDIVLINQHAKKLGCTAAEVIHMMCEELRRQQYLQELGESLVSLSHSHGTTQNCESHEWKLA